MNIFKILSGFKKEHHLKKNGMLTIRGITSQLPFTSLCESALFGV